MNGQFDIRPFERKPLPRIVVPEPPRPPEPPPPAAPKTAVIKPKTKRPASRPLNLRGRQKATVCKVCGAPRYDGCTNALCYTHYLDWHKAYQRTYQQARRAKAGRP